jgi:hypothetical protein
MVLSAEVEAKCTTEEYKMRGTETEDCEPKYYRLLQVYGPRRRIAKHSIPLPMSLHK